MQTLLSLPPNLIHSFLAITGRDPQHTFVLADPPGTRIGSAGATAFLLAEHKKSRSPNTNFPDYLASSQRIIIHAGGQSRRLPAYAPSGKILAPIPVFRWSRGQRIDQVLLDAQMPLFEKVMRAAGSGRGGQNTLIASGDVLLLADDLPFNLPTADVVCLGMWVDPHLASRHGVFFATRDRPHQLDFMLQKPAGTDIERLAETHLFLMDVGVWVLSDRAIEVLMKKSGWNGTTFPQGIPTFYDLYSSFGPCLGTHPSVKDDDINRLTTALVPLNGGEFYHYGTSAELIHSTEKIQNRVQNQQSIWHNRVKPHPSLFVMNASTGIAWEGKHHIWIENSHVPAGWRLSHDHVITGVPQNDWKLELDGGLCLDIVPIGPAHFCVRPYGIDDPFRGAIGDKGTNWMGKSVAEWLSARGVSLEQAGLSASTDIQLAHLFPVVEADALTESFVQWMLHPTTNAAARQQWLSGTRLSADDISAQANLPRLVQQRDRFRQQNLPKIAANYRRSIFYQTDLKLVAKDYAAAGHPLPPAIPDAEQSMLRIRDHMFRSEVLRQKGLDGAAEEKRAFEVLQSAITATLTSAETPKLSVQADQIVWGRSPVRLDLAGGWSDTPPYCMQTGGAVVNVAVDLNGQPPIQVYIRPAREKKIVLRSIDTGAAEEVHTFDDLRAYNHVGSVFSIPKAALYLAGFHPDRSATRHASLAAQLEAFGSGFEISLLSAVPKGSGLGTSSVLAATILGSLADFCGLAWNQQDICHRTLILEQLLTTGGGWQDQYGGILPGIKLLESDPGTQEQIRARWLPEHVFNAADNRDCWLLYYTGVTRVAKNILGEIVRGMFLNEGRALRILDDIRQHAYRTADAISRSDLRATGHMLAESWKLNNALDAGTTTPDVQQIIRQIHDLSLGYKLLGAGGGGYMVICAKDSQAAAKIQQTLTTHPPTDKARFVKMTVSPTGFQVLRS